MSAGAARAADIAAALRVLDGLGLNPADLHTTPPPRPPAPTFAEFIPAVHDAMPAGRTRDHYKTYWDKLLQQNGWPERRIDEVTLAQLEQLAEKIKASRVRRRNGRDGRKVVQHVIDALRYLYRRAEHDDIIDPADNPTAKLDKPRTLPSTRRALPAALLAEIGRVAATTGNDPELDTLLLRLHTDRDQAVPRHRDPRDAQRWQAIPRTIAVDRSGYQGAAFQIRELRDQRSRRDWIDRMLHLSARGIDPVRANWSLADYGEANIELALKGLELKTTDPYLCGWRKRVLPTLGHLAVPAITNGIVDRAVVQWIEEDGCGKPTIKNTIAVLVRLMEQAKRDGLVDINYARVRGWQALYKQVEDELKDPCALAFSNWHSLVEMCDAGVVWRRTVQIQVLVSISRTRHPDTSPMRMAMHNADHAVWDTISSPDRQADSEWHRACEAQREARHRFIDEARRSLHLGPGRSIARYGGPANLALGPTRRLRSRRRTTRASSTVAWHDAADSCGADFHGAEALPAMDQVCPRPPEP
ncbi:hypothetical protein OH799_07595 [Nocardia sp. NBC_00881]|uniref:hypothetical protein n=1 Tax=Nocardia sp. NBC_00881 TaxID=2975995 RepID=UPI00386A537B|nr:hypothetical protein OH799_07595 [Nocardia sp. NBC_00881]